MNFMDKKTAECIAFHEAEMPRLKKQADDLWKRDKIKEYCQLANAADAIPHLANVLRKYHAK